MQKSRNKKMEVASIRRELTGERLVSLTRLAGDSGTDEGERKLQLIWQNFRIQDCTKANAMVLGTDHPDFLEGKEAAAGNSAELFEDSLFPAGVAGVALEKLSSVHSHYFGSGFEKVVGKKLRAFVSDRYEYDEKTGRVKAPTKMLSKLRRTEARELVQDELEYQEKVKDKMASRGQAPKDPPKPVGLATTDNIFDPDKRPRYASTKLTPDECEERGSMGGGGMPNMNMGAGGGKGGMPGMGGPPIFGF
mmetsp:Transcript_18503/g.36294  ORF Transcript_18503/g.36294 Transcript_18503/m.36294 type:complete len:249 (+) Transcript_18503:92-838(+)